MALFAEITVSENSGDAYQQFLPFPIRIGRDTSCDVVVGDAQSGVSRVHATIESRGDQILLIDDSSNGTDYDGRVLAKDAVQLNVKDKFWVRGIRIDIEVKNVEPKGTAQLLARIMSLNGKELERVGMDGCRVIISKTAGQIEFFSVPVSVQCPMQSDHVIHVFDSGNSLTLSAGPASDDTKIKVNNYPLNAQSRALVELDVVELGGVKLEIIERGYQALRCHNPSCRLLNAHDVNVNCRWCGTRLSEGVTVMVSK